MKVQFWLVSIGFIVSNWIYQLFLTNPNWMVALERSFFQFGLVMTIWFLVLRKN